MGQGYAVLPVSCVIFLLVAAVMLHHFILFDRRLRMYEILHCNWYPRVLSNHIDLLFAMDISS